MHVSFSSKFQAPHQRATRRTQRRHPWRLIVTAVLLLGLSVGTLSPIGALAQAGEIVGAQGDPTPPPDDGTGGPPPDSTETETPETDDTETPEATRRPAPRNTEETETPSSDATPVVPAGTPSAATPMAATPEGETDTRCSTVLGIGDAGDACIAVVHAAPYAGPVDLYYGDDDVATVAGLEYEGFADFAPVSSDEAFVVELTPAGDFATISAMLEAGVEADQAYVLVIENFYPDFALGIVSLIPIDLSPLDSDEARVTLHHSVSDAGPLAILGLPDPLSEGIEVNTTGQTADISAELYEVTVVPALAQDTTLDQMELQFEPGLAYVVVLTGLTTDASLIFAFAAAPVAAS